MIDSDSRGRPLRPARGFTLLELLLVLAIVGVITAIAAPRYHASATRYRAEAAARRVVSDLTLARSRARASSASRTVIFSVDSDQYTIVGVRHPDRPSEDYRTVLSAEPYKAQIVSAAFGGSEKVTFNGFGVPDSGGGVVVQAGSIQKKVSLHPQTGEASAQ